MNLVEKKSMEHAAWSLGVWESESLEEASCHLETCTGVLLTTRKAICYVRVNFLASFTLYPLMCQEGSSRQERLSGKHLLNLSQYIS
jgi:hypothetical protein